MKTRPLFLLRVLTAQFALSLAACGQETVTYTNLATFDTTKATNAYGVSLAGPLVFPPGAPMLMFGAMEGGGDSGNGCVMYFSLTPGPVVIDGITEVTKFAVGVHSFSRTEGAHPAGAVVFADEATMYGTTSGYALTNSLFPKGMGSVYRLLTNGDITALYRFGTLTNTSRQPLDGAVSRAALVFGADGNLYGTTTEGGTNGYDNSGHGFGTAFVVTTNGTFTSLHSFTGADGASPTGLALLTNGFFCGVATAGGPSSHVVNSNGAVGYGTVFTLETNGPVTTLYAFGQVTNAEGVALDGYAPNPVIVGQDGNFYGTTRYGGSNAMRADTNSNKGWGTVFKLTTNGALTSLYSFGAVTNANGVPLDGGGPAGALSQGPDGRLYGVTTYGGITNVGTIFAITTNGALTTIHSLMNRFVESPGLSSVIDGYYPETGLTSGPGGLYGGTFGMPEVLSPTNIQYSTLFSIGPAGPRTSIISSAGLPWLCGATNTLSAQSTALYSGVYNWTLPGGQNPGNVSGLDTSNLLITGVMFSNAGTYVLTTSNSVAIVTNSVVIGVVPLIVETQPSGALLRVGQSVGFGATAKSVLPVSYQWQLDGMNLTDSGRITGSTTTNLSIAPTIASDSGTYTLIFSNSAGAITSAAALLSVLPLAIDGYTLTALHGFDGVNDGSNTLASVIQGNDGGLYGVASSGGTNNDGTIFRWATNGGFSVLHTFGASLSNGVALDGSEPKARLLQAVDGWFYSSAFEGGTSNEGTIFKISAEGDFVTLVNLGVTNSALGELPEAPLIQNGQGTFYGLFNAGGNDDGILFSMDAAGNMTNLHSFSSQDGATFASTPILESDGSIYGLASAGGTYTDGTFFELSAEGSFSNLHSFYYDDEGAYPMGDLAQDDAGNFYGTINIIGPLGDGDVFKVTPEGALSVVYSFGAVTNGGYILDGANAQGGLTRAADGNFYGATTAGGPNNYGTIFRVSTNGEFATVVWFDGTNGARPIAAPTQGWDGNLYGTTTSGGANNFGAIYRLSIPLPPPQFKGATQSNGVFSFSWNSIGGRTYQVEYTTDLSNTNWQNLGGLLTASNLASGFTDPATNEQRFYRIVEK